MSNHIGIPFIEMRKFYYQEIHCPFCGKDPEREMREGGEFSPCEHTLLMAHSEFWIYLADRAEKVLNANGISVERDETDVIFSRPDDKDVDYDDIFSTLDAEEAIGFNRVVGPPAMEASWIAFAPVAR